MRKFLKTLVAIATISALSVNPIYAEMPNTETEEVVMENYDTFIQEEISDNTTELDEEVEAELNSKGILDSQIDSWNDDTIEKINESDDVSVEVMYFTEGEDGELSELSDEEVEEFYEKVYEENLESELHDGEYVEFEDDEQDEEEQTEYNKSLLGMLGLEETVYGANENVNTTVKSASGMLKCDIVIAKDKGRAHALWVMADATWLSQPKYTLTDYMSISVQGLDTHVDNKENPAAYYTYTRNAIQPGGRLVKYKTSVDKKPAIRGEYGFYTYVNLSDDVPGEAYREHNVTMMSDFYINNWTAKDGQINFQFEYSHQQKKLKKDDSVIASVGMAGLNLSLSSKLSIVKYYHKMIDKNCVYIYSYK